MYKRQNEDSEKKVTESKNNLNWPILCASLPVTGIAMAFATPNEVITQVPSSVDAPRKPDIVGIATLEICLLYTSPSHRHPNMIHRGDNG